MAAKGWYVLYRDGAGHGVRATDEFKTAIGTAWRLYREGRSVVQVGPLDEQGADQIFDANEIGRFCALMDEQAHASPFRNDAAALDRGVVRAMCE
jgi:hypothetical protein